jgi:hypothetical protein
MSRGEHTHTIGEEHSQLLKLNLYELKVCSGGSNGGCLPEPPPGLVGSHILVDEFACRNEEVPLAPSLGQKGSMLHGTKQL